MEGRVKSGFEEADDDALSSIVPPGPIRLGSK